MGGLGPVLEDARAAARDEVLHAYAISMYQPTLVGLNWGLSFGTTDDRVAVATAAEDAAIAVVAKDVVDPEVYYRLRESFDLVGSMHLRVTTGRSSAWAQTSRRFPIAVLVVVVGSIAIYASQFGYVAVAIPIVAAVIIIATARSASRRENDPSGDDEGPIDLPRPWLGAAAVAGIIVLTLPFVATASGLVVILVIVAAILSIVGVVVWIRAAD